MCTVIVCKALWVLSIRHPNDYIVVYGLKYIIYVFICIYIHM